METQPRKSSERLDERSSEHAAPRAEGFTVRLGGGWAVWSLNTQRLQDQLPTGEHAQSRLVDTIENTAALSLLLGYNILGHAGIGVDVTATGWSLTSRDRGGAGLITILAMWHPVELVSQLLAEPLPDNRFWDISLLVGTGWSAVGQDRALRGLPPAPGHMVLGALAEVYVAPWATIGASFRVYPLLFDEYVIHWDHDVFVELPDRSGGMLIHPSLTLSLRVPTSG